VKDSIISDNTITDVADAIILENSYNNTIIRNNLSRNKRIGLSIYLSDENTILNNTISNSEFGIFICTKSNKNVIQYNKITYNKYGIYIGYRASKNLIQYNNITCNKIGIDLTNNNRNKFYNNNFINNDRHVRFMLRSKLNHWKGNYWDNQIVHGLPKILFGRRGRLIPWLNFDLRPAKDPYEI